MESKAKSGTSRLVLALATLLAGAALGGLGVHFLVRGSDDRPSKIVVRPVKSSSRVTALGRIEPQGGVVTLGIPIPDRLLEFLPGVKEEAEVKKGKELAKLESHDARALDVKLIGEQLAEARAKLAAIKQKGEAQIKLDEINIKQLEEISPLDQELQKQQIRALSRKAKFAQENWNRIKDLGSTVSDQEKEQQKLVVFQAEMELENAKSVQVKLTKTNELKEEAAKAQLAASRSALASAIQEVPISTLESQKSLAEIRLQDTLVRAPISGKILKLLARPGELVGAQHPILQMADTRHMIVVAEVYETDISKVAIGNKAVISGRALKGPLYGSVVQIGVMIGRNRVYDVDPVADVDRRVIEVRIHLEDSAPAAKLINHQVKVEIETGNAPQP